MNGIIRPKLEADRRRHPSFWLGICVASGLLVLATLGWFRHRSNDKAFELAEAKRVAANKAAQNASAEREQRVIVTKNEVQRMIGDTHAQMNEIIKAGRDKAAAILSQHRSRSEGLIAQANNKFQGLPNVIGLVRRMAKDKIFQKHETQDYLTEAFQPITDDQKQATVELQDTLNNCQDTLTAATVASHHRVEEWILAKGFKASDLSLDNSVERLTLDPARLKVDIAFQPASDTLEVMLDALLVKAIYKQASRLLEKEVAEEATALGVGAGGAAIPFVDIITTGVAVGLTIWTAYDIHKAAEEMKKIEPTIRQGLVDSTTRLQSRSDDTFEILQTKVDALFQ